MHHLTTTNPSLITYEDTLLRIEVLGGIRIDGLDRMRVTLKIAVRDSVRPPIRHSLDLYNDNLVEKLIRKAAERLEVGTSAIGGALVELTDGLESYRLEMIAKLQEDQIIHIPLTDKEREEAIKNLKSDNLLENTLTDLINTGIIGEQKNALILFIAMTSGKMPDPVSVVCFASSGVGKSYLMEKVAACLPAEDVREQTQFTGASFYHFEREEIKGKIFLIEDLDGAQDVLFPIRELQTKKQISKTMTRLDRNGKRRTINVIVEGPVCVIACTTSEKLYEDNANRSILIYLDGSREQDDRIMNYQKQLRAGLIDRDEHRAIQRKLQNMQRVLQPVRVINPYAVLIDLPQAIFKPRRTLPLLLSFIEAITFYHQYQREEQVNKETGEIFIESTVNDIKTAFDLLGEVLFRKADELSKSVRDFYEWLTAKGRRIKRSAFTARDIRAIRRLNPRTLNRYLNELAAFGLIEIIGGNKHRTGYQYKLINNKAIKSLQSDIDKQIQVVLKKVEKAATARSSMDKSIKNSRSVRHQSDSEVSV